MIPCEVRHPVLLILSGWVADFNFFKKIPLLGLTKRNAAVMYAR
jgi:hypothetical protein